MSSTEAARGARREVGAEELLRPGLAALPRDRAPVAELRDRRAVRQGAALARLGDVTQSIARQRHNLLAVGGGSAPGRRRARAWTRRARACRVGLVGARGRREQQRGGGAHQHLRRWALEQTLSKTRRSKPDQDA